MKAKLRATLKLVQEYEADSENYNNCEFVEDMIEIDKRNFDNDPVHFLYTMLEDPETKISIKIVKCRT